MTLDSALPSHVGIIMDGNGRWASSRGMTRTEGHREGLKTAKRIVKAAENLGISTLSLFAFSTENWRRTAEEVSFLMGLISKHLVSELDFYRENDLRVVHSGDVAGLPATIAEEMKKVELDTAQNSRMTVNLAINYGGRDEIIRAVKRVVEHGQSISESAISASLDHPEIPDPDLIIRTAGELRLSNFLLWETAYSEFWFTEKLWPDFGPDDLAKALSDFANRDRRYGGSR